MDEMKENMDKASEEMISVIMSIYNEKEEWLRQSIESILNQTWNNLEFIIVNDNPDNKLLLPVLYEYAGQDKRIKIILNKVNRGLAGSMNEALKLAQGKYVARMDADDISVPERLEKEVRYLEQHLLDMVASNAIMISEVGEEVGKFGKMPRKNVEGLLPYRDMIIHPSVLIRRKVLKKLGGYRDFSSAQDYDLWLRMVTDGCKIGILDEFLVFYRLRGNGITQTNHYKQFLMARYARKLYNERKRYKRTDSFSEENMKRYIARKNTDRKRKRFDRASRYFECAAMNLKNRHKVKGICFILMMAMADYNYIGEFLRLSIYEMRKAA